MKRERLSFIFLVCLSILLSFGSVMASFKIVDDSQHKFCQVVNSLTSVPVPKPGNPAANPSRERSWKQYTEFVVLRHSLGC